MMRRTLAVVLGGLAAVFCLAEAVLNINLATCEDLDAVPNPLTQETVLTIEADTMISCHPELNPRAEFKTVQVSGSGRRLILAGEYALTFVGVRFEVLGGARLIVRPQMKSVIFRGSAPEIWDANCPLYNCTLRDVDQDGGFLYVDVGSRAVFNAPSTFFGLRKMDGIGGGAIANRGELRMNQPTTIQSLSLGGSGESNGGWGAGLWTAETGKTVFKGAVITNCHSTDDEGNIGGGLMNQGTTIFATQNPVVFSYNNAYGGGGIYNAEGAALRFAGPANFTDNIGGDDGNGAAIENFGLIAFGKMAPAVFQGGFVRSNVGAGIHSQKGTIRFNAPALFAENSGEGVSGAALFVGGGKPPYDPEFPPSEAQVDFNAPVEFRANVATYSDGGAVYVANGTVRFYSDTTFDSNVAGNAGGAVFVGGGTAWFGGQGEHTFTGNDAESGGADPYRWPASPAQHDLS